jgi:4-hydroxybenzoate polyprenyltransferase
VQFNRFAILTGIASLVVVVVYPFMKRVTYWPQVFLGLAFSWGALMGWAAARAQLEWPALALYAGSIAWVMHYDTIYACQDKEDDALVGLKSTALLFGANTRPALAIFASTSVLLIGLAGYGAGAGWPFALGLAAFAAHLAWQIVRIDIDDPDSCLTMFRANRDAGLILFVALLLDAALRRAF